MINFISHSVYHVMFNFCISLQDPYSCQRIIESFVPKIMLSSKKFLEFSSDRNVVFINPFVNWISYALLGQLFIYILKCLPIFRQRIRLEIDFQCCFTRNILIRDPLNGLFFTFRSTLNKSNGSEIPCFDFDIIISKA